MSFVWNGVKDGDKSAERYVRSALNALAKGRPVKERTVQEVARKVSAIMQKAIANAKG